MSKLVWTDESLTQAWKVIHLQDVLITGLGACLDKVKLQKYKEFRDKYLPAVAYTANLLALASKDLVRLKDGKEGRPPTWFLLGEDVLAFSLETERAIPIIQAEIRRTRWVLIKTRLEECQKQCKEIQKTILAAMPKESRTEQIHITQQSVNDFLNIVATFEMGQKTGGAWRRIRR